MFPHVGTLPDDTNTLSKLVSLTAERFQELTDDGTINPTMGRKDMDAPKVSKKAWVSAQDVAPGPARDDCRGGGRVRRRAP